MKPIFKLGLALGLGMVLLAGAAHAFQGNEAAELRASGQVGERYDGYMEVVGSASPEIRSRVDAVNIQRRAAYTDLASRRSSTLEEAAVATACEIFADRVLPGQYYMLPDRTWRRRNGSEPVPRPSHCG